MSYEKFKQLRKESSGQKVENPYKAAIKSKPEIIEPEPGDGKSILNGQNKHLHATIMMQAKEIKELREDIASLYSMLMEPDEVDDLTPEETRERYVGFKEDKRHLLNRKIKIYDGAGIKGEG
ncbi:MAG: hypothetical protein ABIP51_16285 [Bacteroidia bacterium]